MKMLVLGANGFIGSWLCKIPGAIASTIRLPDSKLEEYFSHYDPTHIVFSIGRPSISKSFTDPKGDFQFVLHLQSVLRANKKATVIFLSSQAVYQEKTPFSPTTEDDPTEPLSPYGWNKLLSEKLLEQYSTPYVNLRIFSCYGEGQRNLLLWDIMNKPELQTDGLEIRDYIHVSDVAKAVEFVAQNKLENITLNLASGEGTNIIRVAQMLRPDREIICLNKPSNNIKKIVANVDRLRNLGFVHSVKLEEGIERYKSWYKVQKCQ